MLNDSSYFVSMQHLIPPVEIVVANGQKLVAEHIGAIVMYAVVDEKKRDAMRRMC